MSNSLLMMHYALQFNALEYISHRRLFVKACGELPTHNNLESFTDILAHNRLLDKRFNSLDNRNNSFVGFYFTSPFEYEN